MTINLRSRGVKAVVMDIEGTTTPITFVYDVLFPYARARLADYVREHIDAAEMREVVQQLREERKIDIARGEDVPPWLEGSASSTLALSVGAYALWLMDRDRKSPGLKALQGRIWEVGYRSGVLAGRVFPDVPVAFERWRAMGLDLAIYSSGSVLAQRLLFRSTPYGDLTPSLSAFFDTGVGAKQSPASYRRIAEGMARRGSEALFISDVAAELDAAREAGWQTALCVRPGNPPQPASESMVRIETFDEIVTGE